MEVYTTRASLQSIDVDEHVLPQWRRKQFICEGHFLNGVVPSTLYDAHISLYRGHGLLDMQNSMEFERTCVLL